jgi:Coenzyme PQQ synthesis protein D (PqqD)
VISEESVLQRAGDVRYRRLGGEAVVLRQRQAEVLGVNEVGARLLDLVDSETPVRGLIARVVEEFDLAERPAPQVAAECLEFLARLAAAGVVEEVGGRREEA